MNPIDFKETNKVFNKPESMTDDECESLPVHVGNGQIISCWKGSWIDRITFLLTGKMWLGVYSEKSQPPVWLTPEYPFLPLSIEDRENGD